ncbi:hypothetical protein CerSpe_237980 [Prunus speciosa]
METKLVANNEQCYEDFEPFCRWKKEEGLDILEVHLPGFKRQDVRVQINNKGILAISGKQSMEEETASPPSRFLKEIKISTNCNTSGIRAKFSHGILSISMPKKVPNLSTQLSGSGDKTEIATWSSILRGLRGKVLSKEMVLKMAGVALAMALGGYAIYRYPKSACVQN